MALKVMDSITHAKRFQKILHAQYCLTKCVLNSLTYYLKFSERGVSNPRMKKFAYDLHIEVSPKEHNFSINLCDVRYVLLVW